MFIFKTITVNDIILGSPLNLIFDGDDDGGDSNIDPDGTNPPDTGDQGGDPTGDGNNDDGSDGKTFSQEEVNNMLADQKRKIQTKTSDTIKQLENFKKSANLTKVQKENIEKQLDTLRTTMETEKQRAAREKAAQKNKYEQKVSELTAERDRYKELHTSSSIKRSITDAASENKAIHSSQVMAILNPNTTLIEDVDDEGNGTGSYKPTVKFQDVDKDGNPVEVNYSPAEAVKRMTELPQYANLFESTNVGGTGRRTDNADPSKPKGLKEAASSNEEWIANRKKLGLS